MGVLREWTYLQFSEIHLVINVAPLSTGVHPSSGVKGKSKTRGGSGVTRGMAPRPPGRHERRAGVPLKMTGVWEKTGLRLPGDLRS